MPAKGNEEPHNSSSSNASQNFESLFRDCNVVDSLVYDIKENLKLTHAVAVSHAGGKMKGGRSHAMHSGVSAARGPRLHPYNVPPSSRDVVVRRDSISCLFTHVKQIYIVIKTCSVLYRQSPFNECNFFLNDSLLTF